MKFCDSRHCFPRKPWFCLDTASLGVSELNRRERDSLRWTEKHMRKLFFALLVIAVVCGCGKKEGSTDAGARPVPPEAKVYSLEDVNQQLKEGKVTLEGTHDDFRAFFQAHPEYQLCRDDEAFSVAVVRNKKNDPKADDIYILANYNRDGKIGGMEIGPPQFSVNNLTSYCR